MKKKKNPEKMEAFQENLHLYSQIVLSLAAI